MSRPIYSQFLCSKFVLYYYVIFSNLCHHMGTICYIGGEMFGGGGGNVGVGDVREGENVGRQLTLSNLLEL